MPQPLESYVLPSRIERETGFGNDQLRKWRERYGFPPKQLNEDEKPAYSRKVVGQLLLIKRLLETGYRPGQVVGKPPAELAKLQLAENFSSCASSADKSFQAFIDQLKQANRPGFEALLERERGKRPIIEFFHDTVAPLLVSIGNAWARNELDLYHEHLSSCFIERYLHAQIVALKAKSGSPLVLFALPPNEHHFLGLLMLEAVMADQGAKTINIGADIAPNDLKMAAISCQVDVVALSFSLSYPVRNAVPTLRRVRRLLPSEIQLWAGGAGLRGLKRPIDGVRIAADFDEPIAWLNELAANFPNHNRTLLSKNSDLNNAA
jgi:methanogenic corrinoid protein MtbC1